VTTLLLVFFLDHIYVVIALVLEVVFDVQEGALDSEVHLLFLRIFAYLFGICKTCGLPRDTCSKSQLLSSQASSPCVSWLY
jgi:hypothetical protein